MLFTLLCPTGQFHLEVPSGWSIAELRTCLAAAAGDPGLGQLALFTVHGELPQAGTTGTWPLVSGTVVSTAKDLIPAAERARHDLAGAGPTTAPTGATVLRVNSGLGYGQVYWLEPGATVATSALRLRLSRSGRLKLSSPSLSKSKRLPLRGLPFLALPAPLAVPDSWNLSSPVTATHAVSAEVAGTHFTALRLAPRALGSAPACCAPGQLGALNSMMQQSSGAQQSEPPLPSHTQSPAAKKRGRYLLRALLMLLPSLAMLAFAWSQGSALFAVGAVASLGAAASAMGSSRTTCSTNSAELRLDTEHPQTEVQGISGPLVLSGTKAHERAFAAVQALGGSAAVSLWHPRATAELWRWHRLLPPSDLAASGGHGHCYIFDLSCGIPPEPLVPDIDESLCHANPLMRLAQFQEKLPPGTTVIAVLPPEIPGSVDSSWWQHQSSLEEMEAWVRSLLRRKFHPAHSSLSSPGELLPEIGLSPAWQHNAELPQQAWSLPNQDWAVRLGGSARSGCSLDLVEDGPHALVAGTTGSGKSALLRTWLLLLCAKHSPQDLQLALIDYKGTGSFGAVAHFPHVTGSANNLDRELTLRAFGALGAEVLDRQHLISRYGVTDFTQLPADVRPARLIFAIDEAAALLDQHPELSQELKLIAAQGRSLGIHLILATQRAGSAISAQIRANVSLRICLRVTDSADSLDVLDHPGAAKIPASLPGSALVSVNGGAPESLRAAQNRWALPGQTSWYQIRAGAAAPPLSFSAPRSPQLTADPLSSNLSGTNLLGINLLSEEESLTLLAETMTLAARTAAPHPQPQLWLTPLPAIIPAPPPAPSPALALASSLKKPLGLPAAPATQSISLGIADLLPERQQPELCWNPELGHLLISGGPGSGRSNALVTAAAQASAAGFHVDSYGIPESLVHLLPKSGSHLRADPTALIHLVQRFERATRQQHPYLLLVDGWVPALQDLATLPRGNWSDALENLLLLRGAARLSITSNANPGTLSQNVNQRLVLRSPDSTSLVFAGVPSTWPRPATPGAAVALGFPLAEVASAQLYLTQSTPLPPLVHPEFEAIHSYPVANLLPTSSRSKLPGIGTLGAHGKTFRPDPRRSVLLVAPQGSGTDRLLNSWPRSEQTVALSHLTDPAHPEAPAEAEISQAIAAGRPLLAAVATHKLVNAYSGAANLLRHSADLLVLDPLTDGGLELLDPRHHYLTSSMLRGRTDLGIFQSAGRAWQVQVSGME